MRKLKQLDRPDFGADRRGIWFDSNYLLPKVKNTLEALLPKRMSRPEKNSFLSLVGESVQETSWLRLDTPANVQSEQLLILGQRARALQQAIQKLSSETRSTLRAQSVALAIHPEPTVPLSDTGINFAKGSYADLLGYFWDAAQDMETAAAYASSQITPSKTVRISQMNAKSLIAGVAGDYYEVMAQWPPYSKGTWFPEFMKMLVSQQKMQLPCGRALIETVVSAMSKGQTGMSVPRLSRTGTFVRAMSKSQT